MLVFVLFLCCCFLLQGRIIQFNSINLLHDAAKFLIKEANEQKQNKKNRIYLLVRLTKRKSNQRFNQLENLFVTRFFLGKSCKKTISLLFILNKIQT